MQEVDLVGLVEPRTGKPVGAHVVELFHIGQSRAVIDLDDEAADPLQKRIEAALLPALVDLQPVFVEEIGIFLIAQGLPRQYVQTHGSLLVSSSFGASRYASSGRVSPL